jgi:hypothetical protein
MMPPPPSILGRPARHLSRLIVRNQMVFPVETRTFSLGVPVSIHDFYSGIHTITGPPSLRNHLHVAQPGPSTGRTARSEGSAPQKPYPAGIAPWGGPREVSRHRLNVDREEATHSDAEQTCLGHRTLLILVHGPYILQAAIRPDWDEHSERTLCQSPIAKKELPTDGVYSN